MSWIVKYHQTSYWEGCSYGENRSTLEYHIFSIVLFTTIATVLLFHTQLARLYAPLARLVDSALIVRFIGDLSFFAFYPYGDQDENCTDVYLSRVVIGVIMFGELHQLFLLANLLGLGNRNFSFMNIRFNIQNLLKGVTILLALSVLLSLIVRRFKIIRNIWVILIAVFQIYIISLSKISSEDLLDNKIISASDRSVTIYRKMAIMQLIPSLICLIKRILRLYGIILFENWGSITQCFDEVCNLLFFIKSLIIAENANVTVEVV